MSTGDENAPDVATERQGKYDAPALARGLQNITNQLSSVTLKSNLRTKPGTSTAASSVDGSWLVGKKGHPGQTTTSSVCDDDTMSKYALAQPPSGAHQPRTANAYKQLRS